MAKCIDNLGCEQWLRLSGVTTNKAVANKPLDLKFPQAQQRQSLTLSIPNKPLILMRCAECLVNWLPKRFERILWFKDWDTYPYGPYLFFQKIRAGFGETRDIKDAPGHVFEAGSEIDYDEKPEIEKIENSTMSGLAFLALSYGWQGYMLTQTCTDYILLQIGEIVISSEDPHKIREAQELRNQFEDH